MAAKKESSKSGRSSKGSVKKASGESKKSVSIEAAIKPESTGGVGARIGGLRNRRQGGRGKIVVLLIILLGVLYYFRSTFLVALVNNRPIFRTTVIGELEKQGGAQVLESLVTRLLITQEAKRVGVTVAQSEIDAEINKLTESISAQGQTLDQFLTFQGLTKEDLEANIEIQKLAEGLLADKIVISAQEVASYIEENAGALPPDLGEEQIREQLKQQKLSTEFQPFITSLQESSDIKYIREY